MEILACTYTRVLLQLSSEIKSRDEHIGSDFLGGKAPVLRLVYFVTARHCWEKKKRPRCYKQVHWCVGACALGITHEIWGPKLKSIYIGMSAHGRLRNPASINVSGAAIRPAVVGPPARHKVAGRATGEEAAIRRAAAVAIDPGVDLD
jgi:hypothetical protein